VLELATVHWLNLRPCLQTATRYGEVGLTVPLTYLYVVMKDCPIHLDWQFRTPISMQRPMLCRPGSRVAPYKHTCAGRRSPTRIASLGRRSARLAPRASVGAATLGARDTRTLEAERQSSAEHSHNGVPRWERLVLEQGSSAERSTVVPSQPPHRGPENRLGPEDGFAEGERPQERRGSRLEVPSCLSPSFKS